MLRKLIPTLILFLLACAAVSAQNEQNAYEIALQRIEDARVNEYAQLYLADLGLEILPPEIGTLDKLLELRLDDNNLSTLPPEIGQLESLTRLNLQSNQLRDLPDEIGNLQQLERLQLGNNQLQNLPPTIGNLANLEILTLENNLLVSIPEEIAQLSNLCHLDVSQNQIQSLPQGVGQWITLYYYNNSPSNCFPHGFDSGFLFNDNPLISPPPEVAEQGSIAILEYFRHEADEAEQHLQRFIAGGVGFTVILVVTVLGLLWRNRQGKSKGKNQETV